MADYKKLMQMASDQEPEMDEKAKSKLEVLMQLKELAADMMGEDLTDGMKQVTVAAPDKEGLEEGLETAEDMMEGDMMPEDMSMEEEMPEDLDEIQRQIDELQRKKEMLAQGV